MKSFYQKKTDFRLINFKLKMIHWSNRLSSFFLKHNFKSIGVWMKSVCSDTVKSIRILEEMHPEGSA